MITCQYCGASYQEFQTTCSRCGATLKAPGKLIEGTVADQFCQIVDNFAETVGQNTPNSGVAKIRQICETHEDAKEFRPRGAIPDKKMKTAKKAFSAFPKGKEIFLFCDTHPLDKGKRGFLICEDGLYWQNSWAIDSNRNYLSWEDFSKREPNLKGFTLELGRGDAIGLAGLGSDEKREKALRLLTEIKNAITK
jgi:hypothetical protein